MKPWWVWSVTTLALLLPIAQASAQAERSRSRPAAFHSRATSTNRRSAALASLTMP